MGRKSILFILLVSTLLSLGTGCSTKTQGLKYSNLIDETMQMEVSGLLAVNGVGEEEIGAFLMQVQDYNDLMGNMRTAHSGFKTIEEGLVPYDGDHVLTTWSKANRTYGDLNGRITAFELYKDFIQCDAMEEMIQDISLLFDFSIMDTNPLANTIKNERAKFIKLYESIPINEGIEAKEYGEIIQQTWENRDIGFLEASDMTMVNAFVYNQETRAVFVAQAGIMIEVEGNVLFIEKYAPMFPYQVTEFPSKKAVARYLKRRLETEYTEENQPFVIMENMRIMD